MFSKFRTILAFIAILKTVKADPNFQEFVDILKKVVADFEVKANESPESWDDNVVKAINLFISFVD